MKFQKNEYIQYSEWNIEGTPFPYNSKNRPQNNGQTTNNLWTDVDNPIILILQQVTSNKREE